MSKIIIVDSQESSKTARFWKKHRSLIFSRLKKSSVHITDSLQEIPSNIQLYQQIILVGSDSFFSRIITLIYPLTHTFNRKPSFAFISSEKNSAIAKGLHIPNQLDLYLQSIQEVNSIPFDVVKCHFLDMEGNTKEHIMLNDAVFGVKPMQFKFLMNNLVNLFAMNWLEKKPSKHIEIHEGIEHVFSGNYLFSFLLLGNQVINGPKIKYRPRIGLRNFDYLQCNHVIKKLSDFKQCFSSQNIEWKKQIFHHSSDKLRVKGTGKGNFLIIDGNWLGKLPAKFELIQKAFDVISYMEPIHIKPHWNKEQPIVPFLVQPARKKTF
ncbi:MAG: hypothetical protein ACI86H_001017 [bacterium]